MPEQRQPSASGLEPSGTRRCRLQWAASSIRSNRILIREGRAEAPRVSSQLFADDPLGSSQLCPHRRRQDRVGPTRASAADLEFLWPAPKVSLQTPELGVTEASAGIEPIPPGRCFRFLAHLTDVPNRHADCIRNRFNPCRSKSEARRSGPRRCPTIVACGPRSSLSKRICGVPDQRAVLDAGSLRFRFVFRSVIQGRSVVASGASQNDAGCATVQTFFRPGPLSAVRPAEELRNGHRGPRRSDQCRYRRVLLAPFDRAA